MDDAKRQKRKNIWANIAIAVLAVLTVLLVALGGYLACRHVFPSDKDLFVRAHINSAKDKTEEEKPDLFYQTVDGAVSLSGGFIKQDMAEQLSTLSIHTESASLAEGNGFFRFALGFGEETLLSAEGTDYGGASYAASSELTDGAFYCGESAAEIFNLLLGGQGISADRHILDGVDKETLQNYLMHYGAVLYRSLPDSAFTKTETENGTAVTLSGSMAWLLTDTVSALRGDYGLKNFLYTQREQLVSNIHEMYAGAAFLLPVMTQAEFEKGYDEALNGFLADIADSGTTLTLTAVIDENRRVVSDEMVIANGEAAALRLSAHQNGSFFVEPYSEERPLFTLENLQTEEGTATDSVLTLSMDVNDYSKSPSQEAKMVHITAHTVTDTDITPYEARPPETFVALSALSEEEKQKITDSANQTITDLFTRLALMLW